MADVKNPYGKNPGGGIAMPPYYKPTKYMTGSRSQYFPLTETIGPDEMRVSFLGSTPFPPTKDQAGTCIMVELGNGERFFFDFGSGCVRNIVAMQIAPALINNVFITHLHVDHYADVPYIVPFRAWMGGYTPFHVTGPSGRTPELGTKAMCENMMKMMKWHTDAFDVFPIGDGYKVEVNEFDWKDENGICYEKNGVTVRHWKRSHAKDGASAYRLDWNGLSFVWTGDGRPDQLTAKYAKGCDVFVTELSGADTSHLSELKYGLPAMIANYTLDTHHTHEYAAGYLIKQVNPRIGMITHIMFDEDMANEYYAGVRAHWDGLFCMGMDVTVVNVTKDAIWTRKAVLPSGSGMTPPMRELMAKAKMSGVQPPPTFTFPEPRLPREAQQEQATRDLEIDQKLIYPPDVYREQVQTWPKHYTLDIAAMLGQKKPDAK